jgi:hypothetical protein
MTARVAAADKLASMMILSLMHDDGIISKTVAFALKSLSASTQTLPLPDYRLPKNESLKPETGSNEQVMRQVFG